MQTLIPSLLLLLQATTLTLSITQSYFDICRCRNRGNFTTTTQQQTLASTLHSLTVNHNRFYRSTAVKPPVNAVALCRGDIKLNDCNNCVTNSVSSLKKNCPNQKQAVVWNSNCIVHYSDHKIIGVVDNWTIGNESSTATAPNVTEFNIYLNILAVRLRKEAVEGGLVRKMGVGNVSVTDTLVIYMMMQCMPDLSSDECGMCLEDTVSEVWDCCSGRVNARVFTPSCFVRYAIKPFYGDIEVTLGTYGG